MGATKKEETVEVIAEVAEAEVATKKKKKSKKTKEETEEAVVEETPAAEEGDKKKKKKKRSAEEAEVETPVEEKAEEEEEPKKKKKKSKKAAAEEEEEAKKADSDDEDEPEPEAKRPKTEEKTEESGEAESTTVFIGGFPYSCTEETIKKDFEECGEIVSFRFPKDYEGNPKGIAFCQFANQEGVKKALEYNETDYGGRTLRVRVADDSPPGGKGDKGKGKKGKKGGNREPGAKPDGCKSVIVKNFSYEASEDDLWSHFEGIGTIERLKLLTDRDTGASKGIAFLDFATSEDVDKCMSEKQNSDMGGRAIFIDYSGGKGEGKKGEGKKGGKGDGKKGDGKKGKGKGKKGKKGSDPSFAARNGSIQESTGTTKSFDSDSE